ncbi:MAG: tRNA (guanosine(46)-N7)-methyltransferase TrmB [Chitinophagales bacterium]|nr:tRNA (guanosine(46)-N7)-methyltransferase TrmB [Chitinophagales bacterium]
MAKKKLLHLSELAHFSNVFQHRKDLKGMWQESVFKNNNNITLELGCGKGEYSISLARQFITRNFIGIDIKGSRIWRGAKTALEENRINVVFLRAYIDHLTEYFTSEEVHEIWIPFPDPYPENRNARKRLTAARFLDRYRKILKPGGIIHLKTDDMMLYTFTLETLEKNDCRIIFCSDNILPLYETDKMLSIQTFYEQKHISKGKTIKYIRFSFK